ncbi:M14 family metallopeptidase [Aliikangiella coralliicola]|uniref:Carboxypeptidase family protein n=1 Tax=Aliikangiella coralliicola TaxID=2592383 RepID=A0A545U4P2_9GAMM|nr:M14-type cytosolic carboxypeptidase [Aliikangiella coralliicola]TQV84450.1 carboxypeptidase family protein [Aliikangiella coralliicola]
MQINSNFDGGNIRCLKCDDPSDIQLEIENDNNSDFYQWFYFRLTGAEGQDCQIKFANASGVAYLDGWKDYQAVASYDREFWFRVPTSYQDGVLQIDHMPEYQSVYYAYFAPYSTERLADFVGWAIGDPKVQLNTLGKTLDGQDLDQLIIGRPEEGKKKIWVHARQHPGETMGSWWMEGFLHRLLDEDEALSRQLLDKAVFYVVPNMNPDGSRRGHLRTNAAGANLNREWLEPTMERSPEVYLVREQMHKIGVNFCLDVHGDEGLPYNFIAGAEGVPKWNERLADLHGRFGESMMKVNPDFQMKFGYPADEPGKANMTICTNYIAETFECPSITLEMPFKDTNDTPQPLQGWSPERCVKLGASAIDALYEIIDDL